MAVISAPDCFSILFDRMITLWRRVIVLIKLHFLASMLRCSGLTTKQFIPCFMPISFSIQATRE